MKAIQADKESCYRDLVPDSLDLEQAPFPKKPANPLYDRARQKHEQELAHAEKVIETITRNHFFGLQRLFLPL